MFTFEKSSNASISSLNLEFSASFLPMSFPSPLPQLKTGVPLTWKVREFSKNYSEKSGKITGQEEIKTKEI